MGRHCPDKGENKMGRKSIKENKNIYQQKREELGLTREQAAELLQFMSDDRIEKIENGKALPKADEILAMANAYKDPSLCNYFCTHECEIGRKYVPEVSQKDLAQITVEMLAGINSLNKEKERLIEIAVDGVVDQSEMPDFEKISTRLNELAKSIASLQLWVDKSIKSGKISK